MTVVKLKKIYADIKLINQRASADYGSPDGWVYPQQYDYDAVVEFLKTYYQPYLRSAQIYQKGQLQKAGYRPANLNGRFAKQNLSGIMLSDGRFLTFFPHGNYMWIYADINGINGPNRVGLDIFIFAQYYAQYAQYVPFLWGERTDYNNLINPKDDLSEGNTQAYGCNKKNKGKYAGWYCGALIKYNDWKITKDYPW